MSDRLVDLVVRSCPEIRPEVVPVDASAFADLPVIRHCSHAIYLRLLIPSLFAGDTRVAYVDADMAVLGDVGEMLATPLDGRPLGAVADPAVPSLDAPGGVCHWQDLGLDGRTPCFHSGILLVDPKVWDELGVAEEVVAYPRRCGEGVSPTRRR